MSFTAESPPGTGPVVLEVALLKGALPIQYAAVSVLVSICCKYRLVDGLRRSKIAMSYRAVAKEQEYWRLGTSLFLFDVETPFDIYTLVALFSCLASLEQYFFKRAPSGMITTLAFMATLLFAPGFYMRELRLKEPSVMMFVAIVTWANARFRPSAKISTWLSWFGPLLPIAMPHLRAGELDLSLLKRQGLAIAAGLACALLVPEPEDARALQQKRRRAARRKARKAVAGGGDGGVGPGTSASVVTQKDDSSDEDYERL